MPTYTYQCPNCETRRDVFKALANLDRPEPCDNCATPMGRRITAALVIGDYAGYTCPVTGSWIEGRKAHTENLKKHGCRVLETGETEEYKRGRVKADADLDKSIDSTVEQFYETLPTEKREALAVAVQSGLEARIERM